MAVSFSHSRWHGLFCPVFRDALFRHIARQYLRDALPADVSSRIGYADTYHSLRPVCCRGHATETSVVECFFPHFFPLSADAGRRICLLQQHALPSATEIYGRAVRVAHSHRSVGCRPVAIYIKQQSGTRAWHRRSYAAGYKYPLQRIATTGHSAGTEAYSGMAFYRYAGHCHRFALHSIP